MIVVCVIVTPAAAYVASSLTPKKYTATSSVLFRDPAFDQLLFGSSTTTRSNDPDRRAGTNLNLLQMAQVSRMTERKLKLPKGTVSDAIEVTPSPNSDIIDVRATVADPQEAAEIANVYGETFIGLRRASDQASLADARQTVIDRLRDLRPQAQRTAVGQQLQRRADELDLLRSLQTGNAQLTERASVPTVPSTPRTRRNVAGGFVVGLVLAGVLIAVLERRDRRLRSPQEAAAVYDAPLLTIVPRKPDTFSLQTISGGDLEPFAMLRANLSYFNVGEPVRTLLVTSAASGDGKSTVSLLLAISASLANSRVLLIDADLRRPVLAERMNIVAPPAGLSEYLSGAAQLEDIVVETNLADLVPELGSATSDAQTITTIAAGGVPPNPAELLDTPRMRELLAQVREDFDLVVLDTPPILRVPDAIPLVSQADGTLLVAAMDETDQRLASALRTQLDNLNGRVLGVVANRAGGDRLSSLYGYGYGYGGYGYGYAPSADKDRYAAANRD